jgi:hypothetical protein
MTVGSFGDLSVWPVARSLIERILRHRRGCATCARGDGHPLAVLTVSYPGGRTRQISLRRAQVPEVRRCVHRFPGALGYLLRYAWCRRSRSRRLFR